MLDLPAGHGQQGAPHEGEEHQHIPGQADAAVQEAREILAQQTGSVLDLPGHTGDLIVTVFPGIVGDQADEDHDPQDDHEDRHRLPADLLQLHHMPP